MTSHSAMGLPWYTRADYRETVAVMVDCERLPKSFDAWLIRAEAIEATDQGPANSKLRWGPQPQNSSSPPLPVAAPRPIPGGNSPLPPSWRPWAARPIPGGTSPLPPSWRPQTPCVPRPRWSTRARNRFARGSSRPPRRPAIRRSGTRP
jgi:hypothetical protein